jgi:flagellar capping protein FliD
VGATDGIARRLQSFTSTFSTDILSARLTGFTSSLSRLDDKIENLEVLMDLKERRLRAQFTAMERAVALFQSQGQDLAARLGAL